MSTRAPDMAPPADACPEPEELAAYIDGGLSPDERTRIERHLARCADCRDIVAGSVAMMDGTQGAGVPWRRRRVMWTGLGTLLAAAAAIMVIVYLNRPSPYYLPEMKALARLETPTRPIEPRLTGGFRYAAPPVVTRGAGDASNGEWSAAAETVRREIAPYTGAAADAARGVTFLLAGDPDHAIRSLEQATASPAATPRMWSDLAAAYIQRGRPEDLTAAVAATGRALTTSSAPAEALFNRALALERLGRDGEALTAWRGYAGRETDQPWQAEARRHIERLSGSTPSTPRPPR